MITSGSALRHRLPRPARGRARPPPPASRRVRSAPPACLAAGHRRRPRGPAVISWGTNCFPIAPVAPATKTFMSAPFVNLKALTRYPVRVRQPVDSLGTLAAWACMSGSAPATSGSAGPIHGSRRRSRRRSAMRGAWSTWAPARAPTSPASGPWSPSSQSARCGRSGRPDRRPAWTRGRGPAAPRRGRRRSNGDLHGLSLDQPRAGDGGAGSGQRRTRRDRAHRRPPGAERYWLLRDYLPGGQSGVRRCRR